MHRTGRLKGTYILLKNSERERETERERPDSIHLL